MDRKASVKSVEAVVEKEKAAHVETDSMSSSTVEAERRASVQEEVRQVTDLSAKEQVSRIATSASSVEANIT
jgi:hypothetical protein